jgi:thiamine pyrophosphate-dependent acetolactate synthase large subunit-like protein
MATIINTMKVFEALASAIAAEGIDRIFAVIGDANQEIIVELCEKHGLKFVHTHHETAAVGMADGYARLSGKIGLAATTQGPGYTNATTSLVSARLHRSPVLMLAGHASLRDPYNPQGMLDQHAMAKLTTGATVKIDHANNVDYCLGEAFRQLKANKGPFVLNMPQDVLHAVLPDEKWTYRPITRRRSCSARGRRTLPKLPRFWPTPNDRLFFVGLAPPKARPSPRFANWPNISARQWQPHSMRQVFALSTRFISVSAAA